MVYMLPERDVYLVEALYALTISVIFFLRKVTEQMFLTEESGGINLINRADKFH